jgi:hypothetical protein
MVPDTNADCRHACRLEYGPDAELPGMNSFGLPHGPGTAHDDPFGPMQSSHSRQQQGIAQQQQHHAIMHQHQQNQQQQQHNSAGIGRHPAPMGIAHHGGSSGADHAASSLLRQRLPSDPLDYALAMQQGATSTSGIDNRHMQQLLAASAAAGSSSGSRHMQQAAAGSGSDNRHMQQLLAGMPMGYDFPGYPPDIIDLMRHHRIMHNGGQFYGSGGRRGEEKQGATASRTVASRARPGHA